MKHRPVIATLIHAGTAAVLAAALALAAPPTARAGNGKPRRIVSLNLCTDQLVLLLADRSRIASLSFLAADPASSALADKAKGIPLNHGRAEEILPLNPDLVLASRAAARTTVALLRRLGRRVVELPLARTLADVPRHIRRVADAIGERQRGAALIAKFRRRMAAIPPPPPAAHRPLAVLFEPNGITAGPDSLPGAALRAAGYDNLAARLGITGIGYIPLETVIAAHPDLLVLGRLSVEYPSLAIRTLHHPALKRAFPHADTVDVPHDLWACAIPTVATAIARLARHRVETNEMEAGR